jgi:hypothetical protein
MTKEQQTKKRKKKKGGFFYKIYSGNILRDERLTKNAGLFALILFYSIIYVSNRYAFHQELHIISNLKEDVKILKYDILTRQSELSGKGRQSNVEKYVKESESELGIATQPPFLIK